MANSISIEEVLERQCVKLRFFESATVLRQNENAVKDELLEMRETTSQMSNGINEMRKKLYDMRDQIRECQELLLLMQELDDKIVHMAENVPPQLIHNYHHTKDELNHVLKELLSCNGEESIHNESDTEKPKESLCLQKDCKKILFNELDTYPTIALISESEFSTIPKYIIGRQSLEAVNSLIDAINQILKAKYTLLSMGKAQIRKQGNMNLYLHYKKQDLDICTKNEYIYFFTNEDYEMYTKSKLNKIKLNLMTVLRHCKRLREHRVKNDLRYVVITQ